MAYHNGVSSSANVSEPQQSFAHSRLFNRQRSVHEILGGGKSADVLLWRKKNTTGGFLAAVSVTYFLFEWSGYSLLSVVSNMLLFLVVILFLWANAASFMNRSPPTIPDFELSEDIVYKSAATLRAEINNALHVAHDIAIGKDFRAFLKVVIVLWILSAIGGSLSFLTFLYIGFVISVTVPALYENYETEIETYLRIFLQEAKKYYLKLDELVISKILRGAKKQKKIQ